MQFTENPKGVLPCNIYILIQKYYLVFCGLRDRVSIEIMNNI